MCKNSKEFKENVIKRRTDKKQISYRKQDFKCSGRIIKNMWRKVGDCGTFELESGCSGYVHG